MLNHPPPKPPAPPPGSIDFELTDFEDARHVLDDLPPGVIESKHLQPGFWEEQRRKPVATDRALTGLAMDWVIGLPAALRPHAMCEHFPRVANAIAVAWADTAYSVLELVRAYEQASGRPVPYALAPRRPGDAAACYADPRLAADLLGWRAQRNLASMCADSWRWQRLNPDGFASAA